MKVTVEDLSPVKKKIVIEVPPEDIDRQIDAAYKELGLQVSVHGFRKGKVPKAILESRYKEHILGEVVSRVIEDSYPRVIRDKSLFPVSRPEINVKEGIERGRPFSYTATVEVRPSITVEGYTGMELSKEAVRVADDEVEKAMELLREKHAYFSEVERAAQEKDMVVIDFEGFESGKPIKNAKAAEYPVIIGTNTLLADIENSLKAMKKGDEREVNVIFPEEYNRKELAGREGVFKVKVRAVKERVLPAMDDEFARDLKLDNLAQLKDKVKEGIMRQKEAAENERVKKEILGRLIEKNAFETPPALVSAYLQSMLAQAAENLKKGLMRPEDAGMAPEKLREIYEEVAETRVREEMILDAVAGQEGITVSEEEIDLKIKEMANQRFQDSNTLKKQLIEKGADSVLRAGMLEEKVFDFIIGKAKMKMQDGR